MNKEYRKAMQYVMNFGDISRPRGMETREVYNYTFTLFDPTDNISTLKPLHTRLKYAEAELMWYISGSNKIADMKEFSHLWEQFSDDGIHVNSAYGQYIFKSGWIPKYNISQWDWVKNKLRQDVDSRQAIININQPVHKALTNLKGTMDFPCCVCMAFSIRSYKLQLTTIFRSQDINTGLRNDVYTMTGLQIKMAAELGLEVGTFSNHAINLHAYKKDWDNIKEVING